MSMLLRICAFTAILLSVLYNFFVADLQVWALLLEEGLGSTRVATSTNFVFLYLIFLSLTPAAYISVAGGTREYREHLGFVLLVYLSSTLFLFSNNLFLFIFFYEMAILPIFFVLRKFGHYYRRNQAAFLILI